MLYKAHCGLYEFLDFLSIVEPLMCFERGSKVLVVGRHSFFLPQAVFEDFENRSWKLFARKNIPRLSGPLKKLSRPQGLAH